MIWLLLILILLIVTGALAFVVKVALGVALGLVIAFLVIAGLVWWSLRRAMRPPKGRNGSSQITIDYRPD